MSTVKCISLVHLFVGKAWLVGIVSQIIHLTHIIMVAGDAVCKTHAVAMIFFSGTGMVERLLFQCLRLKTFM